MSLRHIALALVPLAIGCVVAAAAGELAIRVYAAIDDDFSTSFQQWDPLQALIEPHGDLGYRQKPNSVFRYRNGTSASSNAEGYRGPTVSREKPARTFRIVLLGGSTTHGWGVDDDSTIADFLRRELSARHPDLSFQVLNFAFDGYDSYQAFERLRTDGMPHAPDVVIANLGVNDVRNARFHRLTDRDPRTILWSGIVMKLKQEMENGGPSLWTRVKHHSHLARLPGYVRSRLVYRAAATDTTAVHPNPGGATQYFERNLRRIADLAHEGGAHVLFSTPPSAIPLSFAPNDRSHQGYWINDAATTQAIRDTLSATMQTTVLDLRAKGRSVRYVPHQLAADLFLDDCHLTAEGNAAMARDFAQAILPLLPQPAVSTTS